MELNAGKVFSETQFNVSANPEEACGQRQAVILESVGEISLRDVIQFFRKITPEVILLDFDGAFIVVPADVWAVLRGRRASVLISGWGHWAL